MLLNSGSRTEGVGLHDQLDWAESRFAYLRRLLLSRIDINGGFILLFINRIDLVAQAGRLLRNAVLASPVGVTLLISKHVVCQLSQR